ncbi:MAG: ribosome assembly cofactor RimP [Bacteroidales bacterium]|nr:ribosome assembly cofactor RimP [Bacteroidales bacterium]
MIERKKIENLIDEALTASDKFLVELRINEANHIEVFIDSDAQIAISDCIAVSRHIESNLDREENDFNLHVSSAGLDLPLKHRRQYQKHIHKLLKLKTTDGENSLVRLESIDEKGIGCIPLKKNPNAKKGSKKQFLEQEAEVIPFETIIEAKIEIVF